MQELTAKQVEELLNEGKSLNLIDVREDNEVATGIIPGAVHIPLGLIDTQLHKLDKSKEYIIVCRSGNRSGHATLFLESQGYKAINMAGGMLAWEGKIQ